MQDTTTTITTMADSLSNPPDVSHRPGFQRAGSQSQASDKSQTAQEFISTQLQLEADAREALPYQFDTCTRPLGPLRQLLFSCITCNPPPANPSAAYTPAGLCYSCSISCHGEHILVELFNKRNFVCDCGTTRIQAGASSPCMLRTNAAGGKGGVSAEEATSENKYNQNFANKFCGCAEEYDAQNEKGTMFQCIGLDGGCGEDWWHPECLVGLPRGWWRDNEVKKETTNAEVDKEERHIRSQPPAPHPHVQQESTSTFSANLAAFNANAVAPSLVLGSNSSPTLQQDTETEQDEAEIEPPLPPGFPSEDDFDGLLCYQCVNAHPWIKRYAGAEGFLPAVFHNPPSGEQPSSAINTKAAAAGANLESKKRGREDEDDEDVSSSAKRQRGSSEDAVSKPTAAMEILGELANGNSTSVAPPISMNDTTAVSLTSAAPPMCAYASLPSPPEGEISLLMTPGFRDNFCRCPEHFLILAKHPQLLEEEENYEPPISEDGSQNGDPGSVGSKSLLDRGEAALNNMDRVRAIEGVMAYNHIKEKVKGFLAPFAESGKVVSAEEVKAYFETLRGDAEALKAMRAQQQRATAGGADGEGDGRREQGGY